MFTHRSLVLIVLAGLLAGCTTSRRRSGLDQLNREKEAEFYWGRTTFIALNAALVAGTPEVWCEDANDKSFKRERRCMAAALLFGAYVRPGFTTMQMRTTIPDPRWLDECELWEFNSGGGRWPFLVDGSHFSLRLFPDDQEVVGWTVEFTLPLSASGGARTAEEAATFLRGAHPDRTLQIKEFILMYPLPGCEQGTRAEEMHSRRGVGIKIWPVTWFGDE